MNELSRILLPACFLTDDIQRSAALVRHERDAWTRDVIRRRRHVAIDFIRRG